MKNLILFTALLLFSISGYSTLPDTSQVSGAGDNGLMSDLLQQGIEQKYGQKGCTAQMLDNNSASIAATLEAQTNETNVLIALSKQYFEHEQTCGNQIAALNTQLNDANTEHENMKAKLPMLIQQQQLEYEEAVLAIQQDCEATSGEVFRKWKLAQSTGVVGADQGALNGLVDRQQVVNGYAKLFYDDCLASETNLKRVQNASKQLAINVDLVKVDVENSARKLANLSKNLSYQQGIVAKNCVKGKKQLDYQAELAKNNAGATNAATKRNNLMRTLSGVANCIAGPLGAMGFMPSGATRGAASQ